MTPDTYNFHNEDSGISAVFKINNENTEYKYFVKFFHGHMMTIVNGINEYYELCANDEFTPKRKSWVANKMDDLHNFVAII